jgi:hypothetical protein
MIYSMNDIIYIYSIYILNVEPNKQWKHQLWVGCPDMVKEPGNFMFNNGAIFGIKISTQPHMGIGQSDRIQNMK